MVKSYFSKARLTLSSSWILLMKRELFVSKITLTLLRYSVTLEAARSWWCLYVRNEETVLLTDKWTGACLPTRTNGLVTLRLVTLAADVILAL